MAFYPFRLSVAVISYVVLGGFTVFFGMFSLLIREKLYLGEAILAFLFGVIIGPYGVNIFNPREWGGGDIQVTHAIQLEVTRVVLAVGVFAVGVELPSKYLKKHWKSLAFLLGPVMTVGWVVSGGLIYAFVPKLDLLGSLAVAACLTPTDPILASAVINGRYAEKHVPEHLRHLLSCESGCNDGAAFPFLFISLFLMVNSDDLNAVGEWFYITWAYEIILGSIIGTLIGLGFRHLMKLCESRQLIDRHSYIAQYISLALLSNGIPALLGSDDLLAAFFAGAAFAWDSHFNKQTADAVFSTVIDLLFNIAIFIFIGAWMPFSSFSNEETGLTVWRLVVIGILVLLLRRLPIMLLLYKWIPDIKTFREAVFSGHFGPMGVGAVFIATLALDRLPEASEPPVNATDFLILTIEPIVAFMIMCSILIHGLSIPFFNLGRRVTSLSIPRTLSLRGHQEPEWATSTIKVSRPEDIVINRDPQDAVSIPAIISEKDMEEGRGTATTSSGGSESTRKTVEMEGDIAKEREGGVEVREWREGRHLVREYHSKRPGEEVQVEVLRNAFEDSGSLNLDTVTRTFAVAEHAIRDEVVRHLGGFSGRNSLDKQRPQNPDVNTAVGRGATEGEKMTPTSEDSIEVSGRPVDNDGSEEWVDVTGSDASSVNSAGKQRVRSSALRQRKTGNRSTSMRRSALGAVRASRRASKDYAQQAEDAVPTIESVSSVPARVASGVGFDRTDSISSVNDRVARLRSSESSHMMKSRDSSPNRGVRFAADLSRPPSRPGTPQNEPESNGSSYPTRRTSALKPPTKR